MDLALSNLQWLMCHKTKPNHTYCFEQILKATLIKIVAVWSSAPLSHKPSK